ncbi:MAG: ABC transporter permease [Clostridiales bacterium]|nr:ABC transporter permease [Clostridiales bacterium]
METMMLLIVVAIRLATPILITATGAMFSERSGVINLGTEGMMLMGSFAAMMASLYSGSAWVGVLAGMTSAMLVALLHGVICIEFGGNQIVSSLGINMFLLGFTSFVIKSMYGTSISVQIPSIQRVPFLEGLPFVGKYLAQLPPLTYIAFLIVPIAYYIMNRTPIGIRIKAVGDDPVTLETAGVNPWRYRYVCLMICGILSGLGGAYMSLGQMNRFVTNMIAGRGYMAIVAVKMGKWQPVGILLTAMLFGFSDAIQLQLQVSQALPIAPELIQAIPYLVGLIILAAFMRSSAAPLALGKAYVKNKHKT